MSAVYFPILTLLILFPLVLFILLSIIVRPRPTRIPIKDRHVFITGGSSGIGLAIAHHAAAEGARVSILARNKSKLQEAKDNISQATGIEVATFSADVREFDAVNKALQEAGGIDVMICNQGVFKPGEMDTQDMSEVKFTLDVNLLGTFHLIKAALPLLKLGRPKRGPGSIAIMSSQAGQVGIFGYTAYSASKFGLRGLAEALQQEVIADNIYVSLICPPETEATGIASDLSNRSELSKIVAGSSVAMKPEDVANTTIAGIKNGKFIISCNIDGLALSLATSGMSPQSSSFMAFVEVVTAGTLRLVALLFQWNWHSCIEKWHAQKGSLKEKFF